MACMWTSGETSGVIPCLLPCVRQYLHTVPRTGQATCSSSFFDFSSLHLSSLQSIARIVNSGTFFDSRVAVRDLNLCFWSQYLIPSTLSQLLLSFFLTSVLFLYKLDNIIMDENFFKKICSNTMNWTFKNKSFFRHLFMTRKVPTYSKYYFIKMLQCDRIAHLNPTKKFECRSCKRCETTWSFDVYKTPGAQMTQRLMHNSTGLWLHSVVWK